MPRFRAIHSSEYLLLTIAALLLPLAGCGSESQTSRLWGEVSYDGQPVERGTIELIPVAGTPGPSTGGEIVQGRYEVPEQRGPRRGGTYQVRIRAVRPTGEKIRSLEQPGGPLVEVYENYIPACYNRDSQLQITLPAEGADRPFDFSLQADPSSR